MDKPQIFWLDMLVTAESDAVPQALTDHFVVRTFATLESLQQNLIEDCPACIFVDFDYPDRNRLAQFAALKNEFSSVPVVLMTLQHSESLAVWTYRHGSLDYLVKPIKQLDLNNCIDRIQKIHDLRQMQKNRAANHFKPPIPHDVPATPRSLDDKLAPVVFYVQQHFRERIYSDAMARLCAMSPTYFSRAFKQRFDVTFQEFLLRYRVREACKQLQNPSAIVSDVAYSVGFADPSYFTRVFKRYTGVSPSGYAAVDTKDVDGGAANSDFDDALTSSSQIVRKLSGSFES